MDRITWKTIAVEVFSVVFAVLLALGLNSWREERKNIQLGKKAVASIVLEMKSNIAELDDAITNFNIRLDSLKLQQERLKNGSDEESSFGYDHPVLNKTAWNTANITQAVQYMDTKLVMDISEIYIVQDMYTDLGFSYFKVLTDVDFCNKENIRAATESNRRQVEIAKGLGVNLKKAYTRFMEDHRETLIEMGADLD